MASVTVRVPAKVNLHLSVGPPRADGYHDLATVFQAVGLWDDVTVSERAVSGIEMAIEGEGEGFVPLDESNLAWRAAVLLADHAGVEPAVSIHLRKGIPVAGGMAGGSADAAATLLACDALWDLGTSKATLLELAADLGSDVPFALVGGTAIGTGRGERLTQVLGNGQYHWVFALAEQGLSTPRVYAECDRLRTDARVRDAYIPDRIMQALRTGDPVLLGSALHNDLQPAALSLRPALRQVLETGNEFGALGGLVSGSGPTCAFLVAGEEQALDLAVALTASGTCRTVKRAVGPVPGARISAAS